MRARASSVCNAAAQAGTPQLLPKQHTLVCECCANHSSTQPLYHWTAVGSDALTVKNLAVLYNKRVVKCIGTCAVGQLSQTAGCETAVHHAVACYAPRADAAEQAWAQQVCTMQCVAANCALHSKLQCSLQSCFKERESSRGCSGVRMLRAVAAHSLPSALLPQQQLSADQTGHEPFLLQLLPSCHRRSDIAVANCALAQYSRVLCRAAQ